MVPRDQSRRSSSFELENPTRRHTNVYAENAATHDFDGEVRGKFRGDRKRELTEEDAYEVLGFSFMIFIVQMSMNFKSSTYSNAVVQLSEHFQISQQAARMEFGRWPIMQMNLLLVNIWQIPCALAPNFGTMVVCRGLGGLSLAGGSVTLGMTADMWEPEDQGFAVAYVVLSYVGGTTIGPIFETRSSISLDREAKRRRKAGEDTNVYGPNELKPSRFEVKKILRVWRRPFEMYLREPIVLFLSLLSGFSDALIFTCIESFPLVFAQWGFNPLQVELSFNAIVVGYLVAYAIFWPDINRQRLIRRREGDAAWLAERRLLLLLFIALDSLDYMVAAYGEYSASATGGNGFARDLLAGLSAMYATPVYTNIGGRFHLQWASTILGRLALLVTIPIYIFYKFAQTLAADRQRHASTRRSSRMCAARKVSTV
ncbi:MFS general substrate transporter [Aspergillus saccharolyticus JOP 1030-1]|uniref:MFS general substrate transporter n=1 Tax=Aspergillus saccharolyticus JOP 1030-1 TaxID=1450539 RepID=A0A318ZPR7_9EURO|nr:MFS general substrate transporter [Aspergillus saccharolyticus JOP 1030-1]PYH48534.1 MFS general substrate transporter [Aspergillus saccharolyticus JOP 1030-1]